MFSLSLALAEVRRSEGAIALRRTVPPEMPLWSDAGQSSGTRSPTRRLTVRLNTTTPKSSRSDKTKSHPTSWHPTPADSPRYRQLPIDLHTGRHTEIYLLRLHPGRGLWIHSVGGPHGVLCLLASYVQDQRRESLKPFKSGTMAVCATGL
jgi:hypothetical protein